MPVYRPDIAIAHQSRGDLVSLGIRGILAVTANILFGVLLAYVLVLVVNVVSSRRRRRSPANQGPRPRNIFYACRSTVRGLQRGHLRVLGALGVSLIIGTSFANWRAFGIVLAFVVVVAATLRYFYRYSPRRRRPSLAQVIIVVLAAGAAAAAWQVNESIHVQAVVVTPPPNEALEGVAVPYFGETDELVYLGVIDTVEKVGPEEFDWIYRYEIAEVARDDVKLVFLFDKAELNPTLRSPALTFWDAVVH